jgi:hypothetical protein
MTKEHPVVPPTYLLEDWAEQHYLQAKSIRRLLIEAAQWGADQELEKCCEIIPSQLCCGTKAQRRVLVSNLQERRRPRPKKVSMTVSITGTEDELAQLISKLKDDSQISIQFR